MAAGDWACGDVCVDEAARWGEGSGGSGRGGGCSGRGGAPARGGRAGWPQSCGEVVLPALAGAGDTRARGGHAEGDPAGQGRAGRWYRRPWTCGGGGPTGRGGTGSSTARGIRVVGVLCVEVKHEGGRTRCGRVGGAPTSHGCAASTPTGGGRA